MTAIIKSVWQPDRGSDPAEFTRDLASFARTTTGSPSSAAGSRPAQGHRDDQPGRRLGRDQGAGARRPPGAGRRDDHEYPLEHRRYDQSEYEPFWAAAEALDMPLSLHTATRRQGRIRGVGRKDAARGQQPRDKGVLSALSMCDMIFSGVFERHPGLTLETSWRTSRRRSAALGCLDRSEDAKTVVQRLLELPARHHSRKGDPLGALHKPEKWHYINPKNIDALENALRRAGLPEG